MEEAGGACLGAPDAIMGSTQRAWDLAIYTCDTLRTMWTPVHAFKETQRAKRHITGAARVCASTMNGHGPWPSFRPSPRWSQSSGASGCRTRAVRAAPSRTLYGRRVNVLLSSEDSGHSVACVQSGLLPIAHRRRRRPALLRQARGSPSQACIPRSACNPRSPPLGAAR